MFWQKESPASVSPETSELETDGTREIISSAKEGVELIRRSMLDILQQRQVVPIEVNGQPFDPEQMYALGRQESAEVEENTVIQEVVKGYLWQNRILREAQVMVASKPSDPDER
ncbi:nucleotide exchange factor GrpE (plasmid) [Acaryochloris sp. 'Moss Beach']|nr:nucleotide exchange factor GrpE [Acaryochloris sp. 'Moss Beach']UJB72547.1 nucleotide exchange factor GrpE [Acaryochloris sp. 'Moss Beach']